MDTIDEEEDVDSESMETEEAEKVPNEKIQRSKLNRKKRKTIVSKIKMKLKKEEPPKWICSVDGCKWGGRYKSLLIAHVKTCHPGRKDSLDVDLKPYGFVPVKQESWPEALEVRRIDIAVEHHKTEEQVEKLEEEIKKL